MRSNKLTLGVLLFSIFAFVFIVAILLINSYEPIAAYSDSIKEEDETSCTYKPNEDEIELLANIMRCEVEIHDHYEFIEATEYAFIRTANAILEEKLSKNIDIYLNLTFHSYFPNLTVGAIYAQNISLAISDIRILFKD